MKKDPKVSLGLRVRELRKERHMTQGELARKAGVDVTYITSLENGRRNVSIDIISRLCLGLDISLREFFNDVLFITLD